MKWFKHDSNASMDAKLRKLRLKYGMEGYGVYWYCLELIAGTVEKHNLTFELEHDSEIIAADTAIHIDRIHDMMAFMVNSGLFESGENGMITCIKMANRTDEYTQKLIKLSPNVPMLSRQTPDTIGIKSALLEEKRIEEKRIETNSKGEDSQGEPTPPRSRCPYGKILKLYHTILPELPSVVGLTDKRKRAISARWKNGMNGLENWDTYFKHVRESKFLMGKVDPPRGRKQFIADIDFLIREATIVSTQEGKYHR